MAENRIESVPQTTLERLMGFASDTIQGVNETWRNQAAPLGAVGEFMTGGIGSLLEDLSWGTPVTKPGGHGPTLDPRLLELPGPGSMMKAGKVAALPALGYIIDASKHKNAALAKALKKQGLDDQSIHARTNLYVDPNTGRPMREIAHGDENFITSKDLMDLKDATPDQKSKDMLDEIAGQKGPFTNRVRDSKFAEHYPVQADNTKISAAIDSIDNPSTAGKYRADVINPKNNLVHDEILIRGNPKSPMSETAIQQHETQHAMSRAGGLTKGASIAGSRKQIVKELERRRDAIIDKPFWNKSEKAKFQINQINDLLLEVQRTGRTHPLVSKLYKSNADEVRANLVPRRAGYSQVEMDIDPWFNHIGDAMNQINLDRNTGGILNSGSGVFNKMIDDAMLKFDDKVYGSRPTGAYRNPKYAK